MYCVLYYLDLTLTTYAFMCLVVVTCYIVKLDEKIHESLDLHIISKTKYENKWAKRPATFFKKDRIILFGQSIQARGLIAKDQATIVWSSSLGQRPNYLIE